MGKKLFIAEKPSVGREFAKALKENFKNNDGVIEDNYQSIETPVVTVAETVGEGDSFDATFRSAILKGKSIPEAHHLAVEVSAFVCTQHGAMPELPIEFKQQMGE